MRPVVELPLENHGLEHEEERQSCKDLAMDSPAFCQEEIERGDGQDQEENHEGRQPQHVDALFGQRGRQNGSSEAKEEETPPGLVAMTAKDQPKAEHDKNAGGSEEQRCAVKVSDLFAIGIAGDEQRPGIEITGEMSKEFPGQFPPGSLPVEVGNEMKAGGERTRMVLIEKEKSEQDSGGKEPTLPADPEGASVRQEKKAPRPAAVQVIGRSNRCR